MKVLIDRKSVLRQILKIDGEIKTLRRNPRYVRIKHNIHSIESRRFGSRIISIAVPDDPENVLEIKNNSQEMRDTLSRYKDMQTEYIVQLDDLAVRKANLQRQLFERPQGFSGAGKGI